MPDKKNIHLLLGPETGKKMQFVQEIREKINKKFGEAAEEYRFYPFETQINEVIALLKNGSLFSKHKLVILQSINELTKKDYDLLAEYCLYPSKEATLILLSDLIKTDEKIKKALPASQIKIFWELFENEKRSWIIAYFRKNGLTIEHEAIDFFLDMIENNTQEMKRECEKLSLLFEKGKIISLEDIETFIFHSKEENVFTLFNRIAVCDFPASLETLQKIMLSGESNPVQLLGGILWQFKNLHSLAAMMENQYSLQDACLKLKIKSKRNQKVYAAGKTNYSLKDLQKIIILIAKYDARIRFARTEMQILLLQLFLYYFIEKKGKTLN